MPENHSQFVIEPNTLYNRRLWPWLFVLLAFMCLGIALRFAWLGYWMILPFAILDILAVGVILYLISARFTYIEVVHVDGETVQIRHIQKNTNREWKFPAYWAQIILEPPEHRWYSHRLLIGCKGEWVEIGACLTNLEREDLADSIKNEIKRIQLESSSANN